MKILNTLTVKQLREMAKERHIKYWYNLKKAELVSALSGENTEKEETVEIEVPATQQIIAKGVDIHEKMTQLLVTKRQAKDYLSTVNCGTIIAFNLNNKMMSGKIVSKSANNLKVETKFGTVHSITDKDVEWVKTGKRWPKYIYNAFKASKNEIKVRV